MARRAIAYVHEKKVSDGDELINRLLEEGSGDPQVLGDIAHYAFDKFVEINTGREDGSATAELDRAIQFGLRAVEADAANLEAHYYLGLSYEAAGRLQSATDALLDGYDLNPTSPRLNLNLARVLIKGSQHELASYLLRRLYSASHADDWRADLRAIIDDLEDGEADIANHERLVPPWQRAAEAP
jgi:tetratricopeptide (TPR) repeat protein